MMVKAEREKRHDHVQGDADSCIWGGNISLDAVSVNRTPHDNQPIGRVIELLEGLIRERTVVATIELSRQPGPDTV
jgi:hypothetical protein